MRRSVMVATFAAACSCVASAAADENSARPDRAPGANVASAPAPSGPRPGEHPPVEQERLSDEAELARIVGLVDAAKYEECAARLSRLLDPQSPHPLAQPQIVENARIYYATCLIGLGKDEQADEPLRAAIRANPQMRPPDSLIFPARVVDRFLKVREELYSELRATEQKAIERAKKEAAAKQKLDTEHWARDLMLERLASQETVVEKNSRFVALVPFGAGQFQNGNKPLGWTFLAAESLLGATALTSLGVFSHLNIQAARFEARGQQPASDVNGRLRQWHFALTASTYALLGVSVLGIIEAEASFVPEVTRIRRRQLPKLGTGHVGLSVVPDVALGPHDVSVGVSGAF